VNSCLVRFKALASYAYRDPSVPGQGRSGKPCGRAAAGYGERVSRTRIYIWLAVVAVLIVAWMILVNELGYVR
jgi:hypothetical protein